jgi:hypothetical protein
MSSQFTKNLWMLQETLNSYWKAGSDQVCRSDISRWIDPASEATREALQRWESDGYITVIADPESSRDKTVCVRIRRHIDAEPMPEDLNEA